MKWLNRIFKIRNRNLYSSALEMIEGSNISSLRKKTKILLVDDESDDIYQVLKERQYDVYYKNDMTYAIEAEPFEIVIMDIRGVAQRLQSSMEGFALACDVKKKYPLKKVCCYSGTTNTEITNQLTDKKIDSFFVKDVDIDKICQKIDQLILDYADYNKQWDVLYKEFLSNRISEKDIEKIKQAYFDGFEQGNLISLNEIIIGTIKNTTVMLNMTSSILTLIKVLAV